jgi:hypothetical protein
MKKVFAILFVVVLLATLVGTTPVLAGKWGRVSAPGEYSGYSWQWYRDVVVEAQYVEMRDGTKLAVDIYRPVNWWGRVHTRPLPVVWTYTPYFRRLNESYKEWAKYGYVIAEADVRGRGASYGSHQGMHTRVEAFDLYDMTEWFAAQPWCDGNVGMFGCSYTGINQLMAVSTRPPHLKAIFAGCHDFDKYSSFYYGGIFQDVRWAGWGEYQAATAMQLEGVRPVDGDVDADDSGYPDMLEEAVAQHADNVNEAESLASIPYRNMWSDELKTLFWSETCVCTYVKEIERSGIPIYVFGGFWDPFAKEQFQEYVNFDNCYKVTVTPSPHCGFGGPGLDVDLQAEQRRWFDYWLKGIDNGIMDEAPVAYYPVGTMDGQWRFAYDWPLPDVQDTAYYLSEGPSGTVGSVNDGLLTMTAPTEATGQDDYTVDYTCSSGSEGPWDLSARPEQTSNDEKGLTYTTAPLASDVELTGHPLLHLWVSSTATDGDFFAYLEEVDEAGSHYIGYGCLRASHRAVNEVPYDNLGLPFHGSFIEDIEDLTPGEPVELVFELAAISNIFDAGNRIRLTITCNDESLVELTPEFDPEPTVSVYRNTDYTSYITLPVVVAE